MALRSLARETWGPAACALRCRSGTAGMPAAASSRFLATTRHQNGIATRRFSDIGDFLKRGEEEIIRRATEWASRGINDAKSNRELLERLKIEEKITRLIKWTSRGFKAMEWSCYFCVSLTAAAAVYDCMP